MTKYAGRELVLRAGAARLAVTGVASTDLFTATAHGFAAGDQVVFPVKVGGTGLTANKRYYVIASGLTANDFKVSLTVGGATIDFTTDVTAGSYVRKTTQVGQLTTMGNAGSSRDLIDASAYGDDWKDYVVGQQDGSEVEVEVAYDPADTGHLALLAAYDAGASRDFEIEHATAAFHVGWSALLTKIERGAERDGLLVMSASMKILNPGVGVIT